MAKGSGSNSVSKRIIIIKNKLGLHARAASQFVHLANKFKADITVSKGSQEVNGKSIMGVMMLAASKGSKIIIKAKGIDADIALDAIEKLVNNKFGED